MLNISLKIRCALLKCHCGKNKNSMMKFTVSVMCLRKTFQLVLYFWFTKNYISLVLVGPQAISVEDSPILFPITVRHSVLPQKFYKSNDIDFRDRKN